MKVTYVGPHSRYTVADIAFKKDVAIELANDQLAKLKANGVGAKLFATGDLVADEVVVKTIAKATAKATLNPDLKPAPKATAKTDAKDKS